MRLTVTDLAAQRGGRVVFAGVSFQVADRGVLALTGPNGAGKSTLLRIIAGLLEPVSGAVTVDPASDRGVPSACHYLGHLDALKASMSVADNLTFWSRLWGGGDVSRSLSTVGLSNVADLRAGVLSAGQRRRLAIARLLLVRRPVWLLDEPTSALDSAAEAMLGRLIADHVGGGGMAIVATHRDLPVPVTDTLRLAGA